MLGNKNGYMLNWDKWVLFLKQDILSPPPHIYLNHLCSGLVPENRVKRKRTLIFPHCHEVRQLVQEQLLF